jgi:hypothetical protein
MLEERLRDTYWIGRWVGPRASLHAVDKKDLLLLPKIEPLFLSRQVCSLVTIPTKLPGSYNSSSIVTEASDVSRVARLCLLITEPQVRVPLTSCEIHGG